MYTWLKDYERLSPAALTVRAQRLPVNDQGMRRWSKFYQRNDADSIKLRDILKPIWRPAADNRPWSGNGREIHLKTGPIREWEMIPIAAWLPFNEYEIQRMMERNGNNVEQTRKALGVDIESRTELLVDANWNRVELNSMKAWCDGTITVRDPDTGATETVTIPVDAGRYTTAATAWNDAGLNAFDEFLAWLKAGQDTIGPIEGAVLRRSTLTEIEKDAPASVFRIANQVARMGMRDMMDAINQEIGADFRFEIIEDTVDVYTGAGIATTKTKIWSANKVAAIPQGGYVGMAHFAPVYRAQEMNAAIPDARIDVRGVTIYPILENGGKDMKLDSQLNELSIPDDQLLWVINAGV